MKKINQKGFGAIEIVLVIVIVGVLGFVGYRAYKIYTEDPETGSEQSKYEFEKQKDEKVVEEKTNLATYTNAETGVTFQYPEEWGKVNESNIVGYVYKNNKNSTVTIGTKVSFTDYKKSELAFQFYTSKPDSGGAGCITVIECVGFTEDFIYKKSYKFSKTNSKIQFQIVDGTGKFSLANSTIQHDGTDRVIFSNKYSYTLSDVKKSYAAGGEYEGLDQDATKAYNSYVKEDYNQHTFAVFNTSNKAIGANAYFTPAGSVDDEEIQKFITATKSVEVN